MGHNFGQDVIIIVVKNKTMIVLSVVFGAKVPIMVGILVVFITSTYLALYQL